MIKHAGFGLSLMVVGWLWHPGPAAGQDDVADVASRDLRTKQNEQQRYFLIGPQAGAAAPEKGWGLVIVLPGGDGSAEFHSFVKRIYKNAVPEGYLAAQPVAVKWTDRQTIIWPTAKSRVEKMQFTTEQFIAAVIDDVAQRHQLNPDRIFTLSWSSSGPAAYAAALSNKKITGSFIAMSVFKPNLLPPLAGAKERAFFLYHSPDDRVCPYAMAEQAQRDLTKAGAKVTLKTYAGGHGWRGGLYDHLREGLNWLEEHHGPPDR